MTQEERRVYLIRALLEESGTQAGAIPAQEQAQRDLLRTLMNVRPPRPIRREVLEIQDAYLQTERDQRGVVNSDELPAVPGHPNIVLWQGDITTLKADAIVNAANGALLGCFHPLHNCIDNLIHSRSGMQLRLLCSEIMAKQGREEPAGRAKLTPAFNLPGRYILHTVGPVVCGAVGAYERETLASCYRSCLELARQNQIGSVAFCCISTGEFHFPNQRAAEIAIQTVRQYQKRTNSGMRVIFNVFKTADWDIYRKLLEAAPKAEK